MTTRIKGTTTKTTGITGTTEKEKFATRTIESNETTGMTWSTETIPELP